MPCPRVTFRALRAGSVVNGAPIDAAAYQGSSRSASSGGVGRRNHGVPSDPLRADRANVQLRQLALSRKYAPALPSERKHCSAAGARGGLSRPRKDTWRQRIASSGSRHPDRPRCPLPADRVRRRRPRGGRRRAEGRHPSWSRRSNSGYRRRDGSSSRWPRSTAKPRGGSASVGSAPGLRPRRATPTWSRRRSRRCPRSGSFDDSRVTRVPGSPPPLGRRADVRRGRMGDRMASPSTTNEIGRQDA